MNFLLGEGSGILNFNGITQFLLVGWMKQLNGTVALILQEAKREEREGEKVQHGTQIRHFFLALTDVTTYPGRGRAWYALISCNQININKVNTSLSFLHSPREL